MPIYEYECSQCHQTSDALQKVNDPPPEICPRCGAQHTLSRLLSRTSFVLKGGGWYADLYSSSKPKSDGGEPKPAAKPEGSLIRPIAMPATGRATGPPASINASELPQTVAIELETLDSVISDTSRIV